VLATLGARAALLSLVEEREGEDEVKEQALLAVSKCMVASWKWVAAGGAAEGKRAVAAA